MGSLRVLCPTEGGGEATLPLPLPGIAELRQLVEERFGPVLPSQDYILTDTTRDFENDEDVAQLRDGATLMVVARANRALAAPARERISFQPHPKTMTAAGELEYFAAQGRHPFVYALAEFIDNSLRATRKNAPRPRNIDVSLVVSGTNPATARGLVCISDNGCGMSKQELNEWAVMNYSMEERGKAPQEPEVAGRGGGPGAGRFLTGDLSFFGVGSKNAAFFLGSTIKVCTKRADEAYVHELGLAADALEQRYRNQEAVYEEDMIHRMPGDTSTLSALEQPFSVAHAWVQQELEAGAGGGFTRVLIADLKPEVLRLIMEDDGGTHISQELAHLYHYYLHGEQGNRQALSGPHEGRLPNGEPFPDITLHHLLDSRTVWSRKLVEVDDDMETRYLRAQKSELSFTLDVPGKGTVCGVLYYFPFENDHETVPLENPGSSSKPFSSPAARALTQAGPSQMPRVTQLGPRMTQLAPRMTQQPRAEGGGVGSDDEEEADVNPWQAPIFEAFWQGRLIPGARIESLPFMESVRQKRTAQTKDLVPDEAFRRLRGALFFGPAFRVTRNKLLFRDNLPELLATAVPGERSMEKKFKDWLARCHAMLDKSIRFEALADSKAQAALRSRLGEGTTVFERITDGSRTVSCGDVVRINVKPILVGRVTAFTIPQVVREEGCYPSGRVHVEALPAEVYGEGCRRDFSLRRIDAVLDEKELKEHNNKEMLKVPTALRLEPMRLATGKVLEFSAGDSLPETTLSVLNGAGQRMTKGQFAGERAAVVVTQRLWRLMDGSANAEFRPNDQAAAGDEDVEEEEAAAVRPVKRARKGRKGAKAQEAARQDENADPGAAKHGGRKKASATAAGGQELVLCVENRTPNKEAFQFARVTDGLQRAGQYALEYSVAPAPHGQEPLSLVVRLEVRPGPAASLSLSGEGKAVAALTEFSLGEELPPLKLTLRDAYGNPVDSAGAATAPGFTIFAAIESDAGQLVPCAELAVAAQQTLEGSCIVLTGIQVVGSEEARSVGQGLQLFSGMPCSTRASAPQAQVPPSQQAVGTAQVTLCIQADRQQGEPEWEPERLPIRLRPGAPQSLQLLPGHPWEGEGGSLVPLAVQSGQELPAFQVAAFDCWGNPTAPTDSLPFSLALGCSAVSPPAAEFPFTSLGVATVEGLTAQQAGSAKRLKLAVQCTPAGAAAAAAVAVAQPLQQLKLPLQVEASALPASIQLLWNDEPLPVKEVASDDGMQLVACIHGVEAGATVSGLQMVLLDAAGGYAAQAVAGKITASWKNGTKKFTWGGQPLKLPNVVAPLRTNEQASEWIRFASASPPLLLEIQLELRSVAAAPSAWRGHVLLEESKEHSQNADGEEQIPCGEPFLLKIEAKDAHGNSCPGGAQSAIPAPLVSVCAGGALDYSEQEWEQGWVTQGGEEIYTVRMRLSGQPGKFSIHIRDAGGEGGASLLSPDDLHYELVAGPPATLCMDGAGDAPLQCGLRAVLHQVCVRVCDVAGNPTTSSSPFEVSLNNSALAVDGSGAAAAVSVPGGNKVRLKGGVAVFKEVRVSAEQPGAYALRVQSASRKVALQDGTLQLSMAPQNVVMGLLVLVPEELQEGCHAGSAAELHVALETEDGEPLPADVAASSLTLKITSPGASAPTVLALTQQESQGGVGDGVFVFPLGELTAAGAYSAVAEYAEGRAPILAGLSKKDASLRSSTVQLHVLPGPPVTLSVEAPALRDKLTATNGQSAKQRLLVQNAAVQLRDAHGNAAGCSGVQVRFRLQQQQDADGEAPVLEEGQHNAGGGGVQETDSQGRAFFGNLVLAQGSGRAGSSGSQECQLLCEALGLYPSTAHELETDDEGWALCWSCPLLFSDDAARYAALEQLGSRRAELVAQRDELQGRLQQAQQAAEGAVREQQRLAKALVSKAKALPSGPPASAQEARERANQLAQEQERAVEAAAEPPRPARYGPPRQSITHAINTILQSGDEDVVGVMARLATVDDDPLARILSAHFRGLLSVVVVADMQCRERMLRLVAQAKFQVPDMLALNQQVPHRGPTEGEIPGFGGAGPLARRLVQAACAGADGPVPTPLPHAKQLAGGRGGRHELGPDDWPRGCLGYAFNLVRPVARGQRAGILAGLVGQVLVFETLADAAAYREFVTQKLKVGMADIVSLDGTRITGRGIVCGSSFQPQPLDKTDFCFGGTPAGQSPALALAAAAELEALREWAELAEQREAAERGAEEAQGAAEAVAQEVEGELTRLGGELADLDAQLGQSQAAGAPLSVCRRSRGGKRQAAERASKSPAAAGAGGAGEDEEEEGGGRAKRRRTQRNR